MSSVRDIDVRIRYSYARLKRKLGLYVILWFLALLAAVSLIMDSIFINNGLFVLKLWSAIVVLLLGVKLAYDTSMKLRQEYTGFKDEYKQTDSSLKNF
jgi:hypothetical protein